MSDRDKLIERIEYFYIDVIEEFKEAEQQVINDSKFSGIFRRKNYDGNIEKLKQCKRAALKIETKDIKTEDAASADVALRFNRALAMFNALCDAYVQLQVFLKMKSEKKPAPLSKYREIFAKLKKQKTAAGIALHDLDIAYTDYTEEIEELK